MVKNMLTRILCRKEALKIQNACKVAGRYATAGIVVTSSTIFEDDWTNYTKRIGQTFELMIMSAILVLFKFNDSRPAYYKEFNDSLWFNIYLFAQQEGIIGMLPVEYLDFINSRLKLYKKELYEAEDGMTKIPAHLPYYIYYRPLSKETGVCENMDELMSFYKIGRAHV